MFIVSPNFSLFRQNTPFYPHLFRRASNGVPGHDLPFNGIKQVPDENELMFGGSGFRQIKGLFWQKGLIWARILGFGV